MRTPRSEIGPDSTIDLPSTLAAQLSKSSMAIPADSTASNSNRLANDLIMSGRSLKSRSEEHTSVLQSQFHLVCRLLLEKKKKNNTMHVIPHISLDTQVTASHDL